MRFQTEQQRRRNRERNQERARKVWARNRRRVNRTQTEPRRIG